MITGEKFGNGQTISGEEFLHRKVRELDNLLSTDVDNGDQAGACGKHGCLGIRRARACIEFRNPSSFRINSDCENLRDLLNAKRTSRYREELENTIRTFPLLFVDALKRAFVSFVQSSG